MDHMEEDTIVNFIIFQFIYVNKRQCRIPIVA